MCLRVKVRVRVRSEICKLHPRDFEIVQHILQVAQTHKSCIIGHLLLCYLWPASLFNNVAL